MQGQKKWEHNYGEETRIWIKEIVIYPTKTSLRKAYHSSDIPTGYLSNINPKHYCYINFLGHKSIPCVDKMQRKTSQIKDKA
jgi:hypothetical protein